MCTKNGSYCEKKKKKSVAFVNIQKKIWGEGGGGGGGGSGGGGGGGGGYVGGGGVGGVRVDVNGEVKLL